MRYLPLTLGLILANCTLQQRVPQQTVVIDIQSTEEKEPLLIIPKPVYEEPEKKMASLEKLVKDFVDKSVENNVTAIRFDDFSNNEVSYERDDIEFEFLIYLWQSGGDTLQLYGDNKVEDIKVTYNQDTGGITPNGSYLIVSSQTEIDPKGPLRKPLTDFMEAITSETEKHKLMKGIYSSEKVIYADNIDSPKFAKACKTISEYVLSNK